jgi:hypothetical protein
MPNPWWCVQVEQRAQRLDVPAVRQVRSRVQGGEAAATSAGAAESARLELYCGQIMNESAYFQCLSTFWGISDFQRRTAHMTPNTMSPCAAIRGLWYGCGLSRIGALEDCEVASELTLQSLPTLCGTLIVLPCPAL